MTPSIRSSSRRPCSARPKRQQKHRAALVDEGLDASRSCSARRGSATSPVVGKPRVADAGQRAGAVEVDRRLEALAQRAGRLQDGDEADRRLVRDAVDQREVGLALARPGSRGRSWSSRRGWCPSACEGCGISASDFSMLARISSSYHGHRCLLCGGGAVLTAGACGLEIVVSWSVRQRRRGRSKLLGGRRRRRSSAPSPAAARSRAYSPSKSPHGASVANRIRSWPTPRRSISCDQPDRREADRPAGVGVDLLAGLDPVEEPAADELHVAAHAAAEVDQVDLGVVAVLSRRACRPGRCRRRHRGEVWTCTTRSCSAAVVKMRSSCSAQSGSVGCPPSRKLVLSAATPVLAGQRERLVVAVGVATAFGRDPQPAADPVVASARPRGPGGSGRRRRRGRGRRSSGRTSARSMPVCVEVGDQLVDGLLGGHVGGDRRPAVEGVRRQPADVAVSVSKWPGHGSSLQGFHFRMVTPGIPCSSRHVSLVLSGAIAVPCIGRQQKRN